MTRYHRTIKKKHIFSVAIVCSQSFCNDTNLKFSRIIQWQEILRRQVKNVKCHWSWRKSIKFRAWRQFCRKCQSWQSPSSMWHTSFTTQLSNIPYTDRRSIKFQVKNSWFPLTKKKMHFIVLRCVFWQLWRHCPREKRLILRQLSKMSKRCWFET